MTGVSKSKSPYVWVVLRRPFSAVAVTVMNAVIGLAAFSFLVLLTVLDPVKGISIWLAVLLAIWPFWRYGRRPPQAPPRQPPPPPGSPPLEPSGTPVLPKAPIDALVGKHEEPIPVRRVASL